MSDTTVPVKQSRILYFDLLKAIAIFFMILLHISAAGVTGFELGSANWCESVWLDAITRWCVPVFVMISGALALNPQKQTSLKKLWSKSIVRLVIAFLFWSLLYALYWQYSVGFEHLKAFVVYLLKGEFHLWFIFMIIMLYVLTPALKLIAANRTVLVYTVAVCLFLMVVQGYKNLLFGWEGVVPYIDEKINLNLGYIGYYLLGYLLSTLKPKPPAIVAAVGAGVAGLLISGFGTIYRTAEAGTLVMMFNNLSFNVLLMAVAVFVLGQAVGNAIENKLPTWCLKLIASLGNLSLGAYMIHILVKRVFGFGVNVALLPEALLATLAVYVVSYLIAAAVRAIPKVGKYLA